jgi:hypothetical protein
MIMNQLGDRSSINGCIMGYSHFRSIIKYIDDFGINIKLGSKLKKAGFDLGGIFEGYTATEWRVTGEFLSHDDKEIVDE